MEKLELYAGSRLRCFRSTERRFRTHTEKAGKEATGELLHLDIVGFHRLIVDLTALVDAILRTLQLGLQL